MSNWNDLSLKEKAAMMQVAVDNGIYKLSDIRKAYNEFAEGGPEEILNKVNSSDANFVQRLKDPNRKYIQDWGSDKIATHKLSVGTDEYGNNYIYPEVQEINGKLVDFTRPPYTWWAGMESAEQRGDTVRIQDLEDAIKFTEEYKKYYPKGKTFAEGGPENDGTPRPITTGGAGYIPPSPNFDFPRNIQEARLRLYNQVSPSWGFTDDTIKAALSTLLYNRNAFNNNTEESSTENISIGDPYVDSVWAEYLQIPEDKRRSNYRLEPSDYRPTIGDNTNDTYYKIPIDKYKKEDIVRTGLSLPLGKNKVSRVLESYNHGDTTVGRGFDPNNGEYISYYDRWDLNPFSNRHTDVSIADSPIIKFLGLKDNRKYGDLSFGIGKPINFYDRIYLDDYYGTPEDKRGSYFLPEVTVTPDKKSLGGPIIQRANKFYEGGDGNQPYTPFLNETPMQAAIRQLQSPEARAAYWNATHPQTTSETPIVAQPDGTFRRETRNIPLNTSAEAAKTALEFTPVVGDVLYAGDVVNETRRGNYGTAAALAGLAVLPNVVEKPLKKGLRKLGLFDNATTAAKATPAEWTAAQDAAIARGDIAEAQRLRDLHFKVNAPNTKIVNTEGMPQHVYHGTTSKPFTVFDINAPRKHDLGTYGKGFYFTPNKNTAINYGEDKTLFDTYLNLKTPYSGSMDVVDNVGNFKNLKELKNYYKRQGISEDELNNIDWGNFNITDGVNAGDEVMVLKPDQIKLADAVTYDDKGVRIPLGERDNFNVDDIRYIWPTALLGGTAAASYANQQGLGGPLIQLANKYEEGGTKDISGTRKAWYIDFKRRNGRAPSYLDNVKRNLYNLVNPAEGYPKSAFELLIEKPVQAIAAAVLPNTVKVRRGGNEEPTSEAAWAKRMGMPYDESLIINNGDNSYSLSRQYEQEIPVDTVAIKKRIEANQKLADSPNMMGEQWRLLNEYINTDKNTLDSLRHTYATGEPVVINEFSYNSRKAMDENGNVVPVTSPLNVLQNYTVQYDKENNAMNYRDIYDFNQFEPFVPGEPFNFKGTIPLKKEYGGPLVTLANEYAKGGRIYIKPSHKGKFTRLKERTGHSASWFKLHGTPAQKKMATFALNARKWKHDEGGPLVLSANRYYR